jgi:hypothetical protein
MKEIIAIYKHVPYGSMYIHMNKHMTANIQLTGIAVPNRLTPRTIKTLPICKGRL